MTEIPDDVEQTFRKLIINHKAMLDADSSLEDLGPTQDELENARDWLDDGV